MESSSSSCVTSSFRHHRWKYDVFLSFRGEDTRKTFSSHLYHGLKSRGIFTFMDGERLDHGASIKEELLKAIEESQVAVIIFSQSYAHSSWCLDELVKIMECRDKYGQTVIPVFYDVDPSTIRLQKRSFAEAFDGHESRYKDDVEGIHKVQRWRHALTDAASLSGYDIREGMESEHIQRIVDLISSKLCKTFSSDLQDIVGINHHLEKVNSLLETEINDVRILWIWGIGGVGKTTIARAIFDTLSYRFEAACFLSNVQGNELGIHSLQNTLLSELLKKKAKYVNNKEDGKHLMARRLRFMKVLIVLDGIDNRDHLDYLAGKLSWFGDGSRIVVTTRDKHLIGKNDFVYEVTTLADHEAIQLFNQYAFKEEVPDQRFEKLTLEVVSLAAGIPSALKLWGSFLHTKDITEWTRVIEHVKNKTHSKIGDKLKVSYDELDLIEQDIFLDLACFFLREEKHKFMQNVIFLENLDNHLEKVKSLLEIEINDVRIVGIWGMGGVGKTTIAKAIFDTLSRQFEVACFLADIKENKHGIHSLQNTILSELLGGKDTQVNNREEGKHLIATKLHSKKVLVVLDDIDHIDHLDYLAGDLDWFGNGSRIIATTRDKYLINMNHAVYEVTTMSSYEAFQLFNQYAFENVVPDERFAKLALGVVRHANGLPLLLKVWGSFLHKRDITEWRSALEQMKNNSNSEIVDKLKISYDGLEPMEKEIFLDIACFFRGRRKDEIMQILEGCGFEADKELHVLNEKSLVFISEKEPGDKDRNA